MQNYYQPSQQQSLQKQHTQQDTRRRTRSSHPDDNNNNPNYNTNNINTVSINIKQYPQPASLSILPHQPSPHSDIQSSRIIIKQPALNKPTQQRKSNWSRKQRIKYFVFLNYYSQIPYWGSDLKSIPTYKSLSIFIKTRSPQQCKSYHLSMRRNYKSIDQMLISLRQQLKDQQGFVRLVDKYQVDIIAFQIQYKLLEGYGLEEKGYFQQKLVQRSKRTTSPIIPGDNITNNNANPSTFPTTPLINTTTTTPYHYNRQLIQQPQQHLQQQQQQQQCNFKINIKDIMGEHHLNNQKNDIKGNNNEKIIVNNQGNVVINDIKDNNNNKRLINDNINLLGTNQSNNNFFNNNIRAQGTYSHHPTLTPPSQMTFYMPPQMAAYQSSFQKNNKALGNFTFNNMTKMNVNNNNNDSNKNFVHNNQNVNKDTLNGQQQLNNSTNNNASSNRQDSLTNERLFMQQNYNRFLEANKNIYNPYHQGYNPFQPNPFMSPNPMQFSQQFRNQLPFSIPPPGGISYMLPGFNDPYGMNPYNTMGASRFGPSLVPQNTYTQPRPSTQKQQQSQKLTDENKYKQSTNQKAPVFNEQSRQQQQKHKYSQKRKKLLLQCHKHWINWLRAVTELNKRKQAVEKQQQQNITVNN